MARRSAVQGRTSRLRGRPDRDRRTFSLDEFSAGGNCVSLLEAKRRSRGPPEARQNDLTLTIEKNRGRRRKPLSSGLPGGCEIRG